jgi:hypothetical protein
MILAESKIWEESPKDFPGLMFKCPSLHGMTSKGITVQYFPQFHGIVNLVGFASEDSVKDDLKLVLEKMSKEVDVELFVNDLKTTNVVALLRKFKKRADALFLFKPSQLKLFEEGPV